MCQRYCHVYREGELDDLPLGVTFGFACSEAVGSARVGSSGKWVAPEAERDGVGQRGFGTAPLWYPERASDSVAFVVILELKCSKTLANDAMFGIPCP